MPNKTIYVSDDDLALYKRAQELAGNLSQAISTALRRAKRPLPALHPIELVERSIRGA